MVAKTKQYSYKKDAGLGSEMFAQDPKATDTEALDGQYQNPRSKGRRDTTR